MAWETPFNHIVGAVAAADYSTTGQHLFMIKTTNADEYAVNTTLGAAVDGVLQDKPAAAGRAASIARDGYVKVYSGGAVALGDLVASDANGKAVTAATGQYQAGKACIAATGADELITIDLRGFGYAP